MSQKKRLGFRLIYFTIRFIMTGHFHCFIINLSYIFCVLKNFLFMTVLNPEIWTRFSVFFAPVRKWILIILNFGYKTICALNSMFLGASFSFNVIFHKPYFEKMQKNNYNNTFAKKYHFLEKILPSDEFFRLYRP